MMQINKSSKRHHVHKFYHIDIVAFYFCKVYPRESRESLLVRCELVGSFGLDPFALAADMLLMMRRRANERVRRIIGNDRRLKSRYSVKKIYLNSPLIILEPLCKLYFSKKFTFP